MDASHDNKLHFIEFTSFFSSFYFVVVLSTNMHVMVSIGYLVVCTAASHSIDFTESLDLGGRFDQFQTHTHAAVRLGAPTGSTGQHVAKSLKI